MADLAPWEPEETVGKIWHGLAGRLDPLPVFSDEAADFEALAPRIGLLFRGLGGNPAVELKPVADQASRHRISFGRRLAHPAEYVARAGFDGEVLRLPARLAVFPYHRLNRDLYLWLAAVAAHAPASQPQSDPFHADLADIAAGRAMIRATLAAAPGLTALWQRLAAAHLSLRQRPRLPGAEAKVEALIRHLLGDASAVPEPALIAALDQIPGHWRAPRHYRPALPVVLWPEMTGREVSNRSEVENIATEGTPEEGDNRAARKARRMQADQIERKDSLILYKFEALLSWAEALNINRRVEDDDLDNARKAAEDHDELVLGQISKAPATRLKLHLDLAPEDVDRERIAGEFTYPEWDARGGVWLPDHCRVLAAPVEALADTPQFDAAARRRIQAVRRQFEALRPARVIRHAQPDGDELDLDAALRSLADLRAVGQGSNRIWRQARNEQRDLAVSILLDVSRSTESASTGRPVIEIAREALTALAWGLHACGDRFSIDGFCSLRRDRVWIHGCKSFDEPMGMAVEQRIHALRPAFYTRLGAAIRHASAGLADQARARRLLLIITDGKPNDLDHYEGRHGIEDSAMAVRQARRAGHAVHGITIDREGQAWFARIFGQGGFSVIRDPDRLTAALPDIYRHLVA